MNIGWIRLCFFIVLIGNFSCVTSHVIEHAQTLGKGNASAHGAFSKVVFKQSGTVKDSVTDYLNKTNLGALRARYSYGIHEHIDLSVGYEFPLGVYSAVKWKFYQAGLRHLHAVELQSNVPFFSYLKPKNHMDNWQWTASYLYSYRVADILYLSTNVSSKQLYVQDDYILMPGLSIGFLIGKEVQFSAGVSYFRTLYSSKQNQFQYIGASTSLIFDL